MERRSFSIEPYVEASGIMSGEIEVDEQAADSIMKRTALRRDVLVTKGYGRDQYHTVGSEELVLEVSRSSSQSIGTQLERAERSSLQKNIDTFFIQVNDQQIWDEVDEWGRKGFKSRQGKSQVQVEKEEFVKRMRQEVVTRFRNAVLDEKKSIFTYPIKNSKMALFANVVLIASSGGISYTIAQKNPFSGNELSRGDMEFIFLSSFQNLVALSVLCLHYYAEGDNEERLPDKVGRLEAFVPNPQVPSLVLGNASLLLNSYKLIRQKKK